jgi:hypothetical protein
VPSPPPPERGGGTHGRKLAMSLIKYWEDDEIIKYMDAVEILRSENRDVNYSGNERNVPPETLLQNLSVFLGEKKDLYLTPLLDQNHNTSRKPP